MAPPAIARRGNPYAAGMTAVAAEVAAALSAGRPVVALESTLVAHGLPWPDNLATARDAEAAVRAAGAVPATVAVWHGTPAVGLAAGQLEALARAESVFKAGRRDLGAAVALKRLAATTVSATMALAHAAGVRVFATGGLGGVHRGDAWDVSADLPELARTPVLVVCAGAKSLLDLPRTLEVLEALGVPVLGYRTDRFPAFYVREAGPPLPVSARVETPAEAAAAFAAHVRLGGAARCSSSLAAPRRPFRPTSSRRGCAGRGRGPAQGVAGPRLTPFVLKRLAELSGGRTLAANRELIVANARGWPARWRWNCVVRPYFKFL